MKLKPNPDACCPSDAAHVSNDPAPIYLRDKHLNGRQVQMIRSNDGGSIRTMSGRKAHENGWFVSCKAHRLLHWEGEAQFAFLTRAEVEFGVARMGSESVQFKFVHAGELVTYTIDVELVAPDGTLTFVEIKRDARDLSDPEYRSKLFAVRDICEEEGIRFKIVFRNEIWSSLIHRRNVTLFCARRFVTIRPEHFDRLEAHAKAVGADATFGSLSDALEPTCRRSGEAVLQALTVARRVEMDLTQLLLDQNPVTIH